MLFRISLVIQAFFFLSHFSVALVKQPTPDTMQSSVESYDVMLSTLPAVECGDPEAPLKIIMFHSLNCIHCKHFKDDVFPEIEKRFIRKGLVHFTMVDFPTDRSALDAAKVAWEGRDVNVYRQVSHVLANNYEAWAGQAEWQDHISKVVVDHRLMTQMQCFEGINDEDLGKEILRTAFNAQRKYKIDYAPAFLFNGELTQTPGLLSVADVEAELKALGAL